MANKLAGSKSSSSFQHTTDELLIENNGPLLYYTRKSFHSSTTIRDADMPVVNVAWHYNY